MTHNPWLRGARQLQEKSGNDCALDWHGLAGRFAAVHAFYRAAAPQIGGSVGAYGSFDPATVSQLALYDRQVRAGLPAAGDAADDDHFADYGSYAVNPILLADGKAASAIGSSVAGSHMSGTRGLK